MIWATQVHAATGADIGLVKPCGQLTAPYTLNGAWTEVQAPPISASPVHFEPSAYSWTAS